MQNSIGTEIQIDRKATKTTTTAAEAFLLEITVRKKGTRGYFHSKYWNRCYPSIGITPPFVQTPYLIFSLVVFFYFFCFIQLSRFRFPFSTTNFETRLFMQMYGALLHQFWAILPCDETYVYFFA